ncbi:hypothetical protein [Streptomyces kanasensis]|uniref:Uncharacterized protein n=1 Tax=Streptomyces kanasensis TaxID=936756 RepID=A0A100Y1R5_9ACTN|nr:hypothetical protein [Streptomyces kanasensis]KUH36130.1 hypothetical protein ATE80_25445 [Streptomyces kanasensis]
MGASDFPDDLRAAQTRLHQATSELAALCRALPWSVEPMPGWPGTAHPHTGETTGGRDASPGWTEEQKQMVKRLRMECTDLSVRIATHPYWASVEAEKRVAARTELKQATAPSATPALDVTQAA